MDINGYKYWFGDISWGESYYLSKEDVLGLESEVHIFFSGKKIYKILLILGPQGLNDYNCFEKYDTVIRLLNKKYGNYKHKQIEKDPLSKDLFYGSACVPIKLGLHTIKTAWFRKGVSVTLTLLGDDDNSYYIEIEYIHAASEKIKKTRSTQRLLKIL